MNVEKVIPVLRPVSKYEHHQQSQLNKGDIFRATVVDVTDGHAAIRVRGEIFHAISAVPLQPGETALFQVKDIQENLLVLKKQESVLAVSSDKNMGNLLQELGLPVSPEGEKIVSHLLSKELPLSKNLVEQILKGLHSVPENLKENFIKAAAWLYAAGINDSGLHQELLNLLLRSREPLNLMDELLLFSLMEGREDDPKARLLSLEKLLHNLSFYQTEDNGLPGTEGLKKQVLELILSQKAINQSSVENPKLPDLYYFPVPIQQGRTKIPGQIYLVMKNKSKTAFQEQVSLLVSVKTEHMGMLWFDIKVKNRDLNIIAYTQDRDISAYLNRTWTILGDSLKEHSFRINSFCCREKTVASVFELADELGREDTYRSLDIKI